MSLQKVLVALQFSTSWVVLMQLQALQWLLTKVIDPVVRSQFRQLRELRFADPASLHTVTMLHTVTAVLIVVVKEGVSVVVGLT